MQPGKMGDEAWAVPSQGQLCEAVPIPMYLHDDQGQILDVNQAACEQLGYSRSELQALRLWDLEHGLSKPQMLDVWHRLQKQGSLCVPGIHRRKNGSTLPVDAHFSRLDQGSQASYLMLARDISEQCRAEGLLAIHVQVLHELFEHAPVAMAMIDAQGCLVRCNPSFSRLLGCAEAELVGCQHLQLLHPDDHQVNVLLQDALAQPHTSEYMVSVRYMHRGGHALAVHEHVTAWNTPGLSFMAVLMAWPLPGQPDHGVALTTVLDNPWPAIRKITEAIVHELNQPLNSVAMFAAAGLRLLQKGEVAAARLIPCLEGLIEQSRRAVLCAGQFGLYLPQADDAVHSFSLLEVLRHLEIGRQQHPHLQRLSFEWQTTGVDLRLAGSARTFLSVSLGLMQEMVLTATPIGLSGLEMRGSVQTAPDSGTVQVELELVSRSGHVTPSFLGQSPAWKVCRTAIEAHGGQLGFGLGEAGVLGVQFHWAKAGFDFGRDKGLASPFVA